MATPELMSTCTPSFNHARTRGFYNSFVRKSRQEYLSGTQIQFLLLPGMTQAGSSISKDYSSCNKAGILRGQE